MKTHRCKLPSSTSYSAGAVFTCDCGRTYVLSVSWTERQQRADPCTGRGAAVSEALVSCKAGSK